MPGTVEDCHEAEIKRYLCTLNKVNILQDLKKRINVLLCQKEKRYKSTSLPKRKKKSSLSKRESFYKTLINVFIVFLSCNIQKMSKLYSSHCIYCFVFPMPKRRQNKRFKSNSNLIDFQLKVNQIKPPTLLFFNPF